MFIMGLNSRNSTHQTHQNFTPCHLSTGLSLKIENTALLIHPLPPTSLAIPTLHTSSSPLSPLPHSPPQLYTPLPPTSLPISPLNPSSPYLSGKLTPNHVLRLPLWDT